ncbi:MAG TPA: NAD(P)-binding domain-containing protein [Trebonia sp.]|jgi:cation diffusion facilitator CzcD-associated flavoprotein CzcO
MSDVLIIGAGPFGLSISAHLRNRGIEHTVVGRPMDTWRAHMPLGLFLKSEPYGSVISSAGPGYDLATYARLHNIADYVDRVGPLSLERFLGYADWFTEQLVPDIRDLTVTSVTRCDGGFRVEFAEECPVFARQVIIATGQLPYANVPAELSVLPADLMTHSSVHRRLDHFSGRRVAVLGAGQSALQTAALMHEAGADVQVVARGKQIVWESRRPDEIGRLSYLTEPPTKLCEGWACVAYGSPDVFRLLPQPLRTHKALTTFGPSGAWWLRDRVEGVLDVLTGHRLTSAEAHGSGVRLHLDGPERSTVEADHVIAGTGFRINIARLPFMSSQLLSGLTTLANCPKVNRAGESSIPGLYFAGAPTMVSLGPGVRFIAGTHHVAAQLASSVARRARKLGSPEDAGLTAERPLAAAA